MFHTKKICAAIGKDEASVRAYASILPMESVAKERKARVFTLNDSVGIVIVSSLIRGGVAKPLAADLVIAAAPLFAQIVADETFDPWSLAWLDETSPTGFASALLHDPEAALSLVLQHETATTFRWRDLLRGALALLQQERANV